MHPSSKPRPIHRHELLAGPFLLVVFAWLVTAVAPGLEARAVGVPANLQSCSIPMPPPMPAGRPSTGGEPRLMKPGSAIHPVPSDLIPETYVSWEGGRYEMYAFHGRHVSVRFRTNDFPLLGRRRADEFVDRCDLLYAALEELLGWEPAGAGRLPIAIAVDTCGSGCGVVGGKGIEVEVDFAAYGDRVDDAYEAVWAIVNHEMAHNFDPMSGRIFHHADAPHAWTSFLDFFAMVVTGNGSLEHYPRFHPPADLLGRMADEFFGSYLGNPANTWESCVTSNACLPSAEGFGRSVDSGGVQGGLLLHFARRAGTASTSRMLRYLVGHTIDGAWENRTLLETAGLIAEGMSVAIDGDAAPALESWKWRVPEETKARLAAAFPGRSWLVNDGDHDGYSPAAGDCDDADGARQPGSRKLLPELAEECAGLPDSPGVLEVEDFPGLEESAYPLTIPVVLHGSFDREGDFDRFTFDLERPTRLRFTLISSDTWEGWCLFDHTRVYGVWAGAGRRGQLVVTLGPGPVGIRLEGATGTTVGEYRMAIEVLPDEGQAEWGTWVEASASSCDRWTELPTLVETVDFPDLAEEAVRLRIPCEVLGGICEADELDQFAVELDRPRTLRLRLIDEGGFAGFLHRENQLLVYAPARENGGAVVRFESGRTVLRVRRQDHPLGRYRLIVESLPDCLTLPPPEPVRQPDGSWELASGPLDDLGDPSGLRIRFWLSGHGWIGEARPTANHARLILRLPEGLNPRAAAYRLQPFRDGVAVGQISPAREFPASASSPFPEPVAHLKGRGVVLDGNPVSAEAPVEVIRLRRAQSLKAPSLPPVDDLAWMEDLVRVEVNSMTPAEAGALLALPRLRTVVAPGALTVLGIARTQPDRVILRGLALGTTVKLQSSEDLRIWKDVPYGSSIAPGRVVERSLPLAGTKGAFFRLVPE